MCLKEKISSPLEAGLSILDGHHLPSYLTPALEYTSSRLARKAVHLTLVIVRRDYQLPTAAPSYPSPTSGITTPATPGSPPPLTGGSNASSNSRFGLASPVVALKQLVRSASHHVSGSSRIASTPRSAISLTSPGYPPTELQSPRFRWPLSPTTPLSPPPMTPCTPASTTTATTTDTNGPPTPTTSTGLYFFHSSDMSARAERILRSTISKAGNKFGMGSSWLIPFTTSTTHDLTTQIFTNSIIQNEILFCSDGLTLVSLHRLYSVKSALASYSKTLSPLRLEDAVDELRRFVLANNGCKIARPNLLRSYDWLNVSKAALGDLDRMYKRAYGGPDRVGGIAGMAASISDDMLEQHSPSPLPPPVPMKDYHYRHFQHRIYGKNNASDDDYDNDYDYDYDNDDDEILSPSDSILDEGIVKLAMTAVPIFGPPSPRRIAPHLKLQTNFHRASKLTPPPATINKSSNDDKMAKTPQPQPQPQPPSAAAAAAKADLHEDDEDRTARPLDRLALHTWNNRFTIDQLLSAGTSGPNGIGVGAGAGAGQGNRPGSRNSSQALGPTTPNAYDDISPITRGEWGFMMGDNALNSGRTVAVETF